MYTGWVIQWTLQLTIVLDKHQGTVPTKSSAIAKGAIGIISVASTVFRCFGNTSDGIRIKR